jgi:hypothetical protein
MPTQKGETDMKLKSLMVAALVVAFPAMALAQSPDTTSTPRIDKRQANQEKRIEKGVQSGQLNKKEAARLEKGQARVRKAEDKALADGKMTKKERAHIEHMQDKQSKKIYREKHDKQTAVK